MKLIFQLIPIFFGLKQSYREIVLEEIFFLIKHLNLGYEESRRMPIKYRRWFIERLVKDAKQQQEKREQNENEFGKDANHENTANLEKYQDFLDKKFK